nr:tape measure protein [uncultured Mediterranean phage uvMED]
MAQQYQVDIVTRVQGASAVAKLEAALKKVEASSKAVDNQAEGVATSLQKLKNAASQSALANSKAALALEKLRLASLKASGTTDQAALAFQKLKVATAQSAVNSAKAAVGVNSLGNSAQAAGTKAKASAAGFKSMGAAINAAAAKITIIIGAVQTFSQVMGAAFERQNAEQRLKNLTGSTEEYEAALLSAAAVSQQFGMTQTQATKAMGDAYARIGSLGYGLKEVTQLYTGFNTVARQAGVSSEDAAGAFLQLSQGMGAGVLNGENLMTIMERMPQVGALLAKELNVATGQIRQMGADGKITSEVMFNALSKAAEGATDLNGKLTPAQQSMNEFNVAIDKAGVALGTALIPALTGLIEAITPVISAVGTLVQKLDQLGASKVFEFLMAPARAFGELVNGAAGETEDLSQKAAEAVDNFSSLPQAAAAVEAPIKKTVEAQKQLNKEATKTTKEFATTNKEASKTDDKVQKAVTEVQGLRTATSNAADEMASYAAKAGLSGNEAARVSAEAMKIYQNTMNSSNAANTLAGAFAKVANEAQRAASASAAIGGGSGGKMVGGQSFSNQSTVNDKYKLDENGKIVKRTDEERKLDAQRMKLQHLNKLSWDAEVFDHTYAGADLNRMANHAFRRGGMVGPVGSQLYNTYMGQYGSHTKNDFGTINSRVNNSIHAKMFADGGYVTGATQAVVGEGGEPEYIIPASKMDSAMQRYGSGMRGSSVIPESANVSVNYSGSTVDMGGTSYINKGDVNGIVSQAVNQTLSTLAKSPRARLGAGLR